MRQCSNCGTQITCGCQDRIASNGVRVCANCIGSYEAQIILNNFSASLQDISLSSKINSQNENLSTK
jgi:hypothetical protein